MKPDFNEEAIRWFEHMLDVTVGDKPESVTDYCFYVDDVKRQFVRMLYDRLGQQYEQTKLTADFFGKMRQK